MKRLGNLLNHSAYKDLGEIVERARDMDELARVLRASLTAEAGEAVIAANIRDDGELVVLARSSGWAARLRFDSDTLIAAAQKIGIGARYCSVRVCRDE